MKRLHVHVGVHDLKQSIRFYSALFAAEPVVKKDDYAVPVYGEEQRSRARDTGTACCSPAAA